MKRELEEDSPEGLRKRQLTDVSQMQDLNVGNGETAILWTKREAELGIGTDEESDDDNESVFTETNDSGTSNALAGRTAPTSVAASTNSRAGRKFPSDLKKIPCPEPNCFKTFNRPARLTAHLRSHSNDRPFKCGVPGCDKSYMEEKHLRQHIKGSHTQERRYLCDEPGCGKAFLTGTRLRRHAAVHEGANRFRCQGYEGCEQTFRKHQTLQRHLRTVHLGEKAYICGNDGCKETFDSPNALKRHVVREHGELRFWCDECGQGETEQGHGQEGVGFTTLALLQAHAREMHISCPFCDTKCAGQWLLEKHIDDFHTGKTVQDRKTFACTWEGCPKKFVKIGNLNTHIRTAHEGQRFVCGQVDTFDWSEEVAHWNWTEEGCGDTFISKMKLEEHIRFVHLGKKRPPMLYPDPTTIDGIITELTGRDESVRRNLTCSVSGCEARFIRYHDLGLHMQREHNNGYGEQDIVALTADAFPTALTAEPTMLLDPELQVGESNDEVFWFGGGLAEPDRENSFERDLLDMSRLIDVDAFMEEQHQN